MRLTRRLVLLTLIVSSTCSLWSYAHLSGKQASKIEAVSPSIIKLVEKKDITISKQTGQRLYYGKPYNGDVVVYYPLGGVAKISRYKGGLRDGFLKQWFINGEISFSAEYTKGVLNGVTRSWWSNGNMRSQSHFVDGKVHGNTKQWYATGEIFKQMHYEYGQEQGLQQAWRRNGKLYSNYEYINGRIFGLKRANMCVELEDEKLIKKSQG